MCISQIFHNSLAECSRSAGIWIERMRTFHRQGRWGKGASEARSRGPAPPTQLARETSLYSYSCSAEVVWLHGYKLACL